MSGVRTWKLTINGQLFSFLSKNKTNAQKFLHHHLLLLLLLLLQQPLSRRKIIMKHEEAAAILICCFLSLFQISISSDTLTVNQTLRDGDTIISPKQRFELGFFRPGNSNNNRYLGIWYKNIPDRTIVWVANRDYPLSDSTGTLKITDDGNLILTNQAANTIWATNASKTQNPVVAKLLDSGNLVILQANQDDPEEQNENYLWQSFDYPTDTLLPGMKLGLDLKTGFNRVMTSWKAQDDPGTGDYSFRVEPQGLPEIFLMNRLNRLYRSGPWNGLGFSGVPEMKPNHIFNFSFVTSQDEIFYTFSLFNESIYSRLVVNYSGTLQRFTLLQTTQSWSLFWDAPKDQCDDYRECGSYGICDTNDSPVCNCVPGFEPRDEDAWNLRDGTGGCVLKKRFECGKDDGFLRLQGMKLPDCGKSFVNRSMSLEECEGTCRENCSCLAYSSADISINGGGGGCVIWFDDLVDLREYAEGGQDLYVRVAASVLKDGGNSGSRSHSPSKKKPVAVIVTAIVVPTVALLGLCVFFVWKKKLKKSSNNRTTEERGRREKSQDLIFNKVQSGSRDYTEEHNDDLELPLFDFTTLAAATRNFSHGSKLGQGGFGSVFKGILADGKEIAVKRLSKNSGQGIEEFKNEVLLIAKLQHRNLVRLLGCCIEGEEKMLIYEYMQNKSLDGVLFNKVNCLLLDWRKRFNIIVGIARGLLYLHQDSRFRIIHRDLKASNILLDGEMNPKISDFGMARIFGGDETDEANTKRVVGTYGYMAPEYAMDGLFSIKSDVFSFGVLVLEIVSGKRNRGFYHSNTEHNLLGHAWRLWKEGKASELMDPSLGDSCIDYEVFRCIQVGLLCVQERAEERPTMSSVVLMLSSEAVAMAQPKQPGFCLVSSPLETESSSSKQDSCTVNHVTVTMLDAR